MASGNREGRLFRARNLLRSRLTRRGWALSTSFLCMALAQGKVEGAVISDALIEKTVGMALRALFAESESALAPLETDSPTHPSGSTGAAEEPKPARKARDKRKVRLEFLFFLIALLALGFAVYSYISTDPLLMALLKRRFMWLAFWQHANGC